MSQPSLVLTRIHVHRPPAKIDNWFLKQRRWITKALRESIEEGLAADSSSSRSTAEETAVFDLSSMTEQELEVAAFLAMLKRLGGRVAN